MHISKSDFSYLFVTLLLIVALMLLAESAHALTQEPAMDAVQTVDGQNDDRADTYESYQPCG